MSRNLGQLLGRSDHMFMIGIDELENSTNRKGIDAKLIGDILHLAHKIIKKIGLDPADSTAKEIYMGLRSFCAVETNLSSLVDLDYVLYSVDGQAISFNLIDIIENNHHGLPLEKRTLSHGKRALRGEIARRYKLALNDTDVIDSKISKFSLLDNDDHHHVKLVDFKSSEVFKKGPYLLAVGDIVTDAFIALREDKAKVYVDEDGIKRLSMEFGSKPPYDHVDVIDAVGNSANAAVSFARMGLNSGLVAFIGADQAGKDSLKYLATEGVDTSLVSVQEGQKTNYHYALRYGADRTILIKYENYSYDWKDPEHKIDWLYLSMISKDAWQLHKDIADYLRRNSDVKLVFQPGTFHFEWGVEKLADIYKRSYLIVMNKEEAALVTGKDLSSITALMDGLHAMGPQIVIVTDGASGSYASDGNKKYFAPNYPDPAPPYDRTGAGDAFASTIVGAIALGKDLQTALLWAPINAMSVVQKLGAQAGLLNQKHILELLEKAPPEYKIKEITE